MEIFNDTHKLASRWSESVLSSIARTINRGAAGKDNAVERLKSARERYERLCERSNELVERLYAIRKEAVVQINDVEKVLLSDPQVDDHSIMAVEQARNQIRQFEDYVEMETKKDMEHMDVPIIGATAGAAMSVLGIGSGIALITAFGVSRIGDLLSSFSVADLPNKALAWLGKGVLSASSLGMAAGTTLMALAGPIGMTSEGKKRERKFNTGKAFASSINSQASEIEEKCDAVEACCDKIDKTITSMNHDMAALKENSSAIGSNQYKSVSLILKLVSAINRKFTV